MNLTDSQIYLLTRIGQGGERILPSGKPWPRYDVEALGDLGYLVDVDDVTQGLTESGTAAHALLVDDREDQESV